MGKRAIDNRVKKLKELEEQQKAIEGQIDQLKAEIKTEMETQGTDELRTGNFIVRWKKDISNRFDTKAFSKEHKAMYDQYAKQTESRRLTVVTE